MLSLLLTIFLSINGNSQPICSQTPLNPAFQATIYFPNYIYLGQHLNNCAEGLGTLYYPANGSFYYGSFHNGLRNGSGVYVSPQYGYTYGCFKDGFFVSSGLCFNWDEIWSGNNTSTASRSTKVKNLVSEVQKKLPANMQTDPSGYQIVEIDPTTPLGTSLLGGH